MQTFRLTLGDTGLGHGVGLGDTWGHGTGTRGGFRGPAWWNETFRVRDTGLGHGVGLGDTWGHGAGTWGWFRGPPWWNENFRRTLHVVVVNIFFK